ncbi:hypothetical protein Tco_1126490, partial [Tanacetum coccineum]
ADVDGFKRCFTSYTFDVGYRPTEYEVGKLAREFKGLTCVQQFSWDIIVLLNDNELLEYMSVHDNDASKSSQPSWGETCTLMLLGQLLGGSSVDMLRIHYT